ncbi:MAG: c-type cytochrome [Acidobacteriota bacterium]|jgi:cytochrome c2
MKKVFCLAVVVGLVLACGIAAFSAPQASAKKGEDVYAKQNCKVCHSIAKVGGKNPLDGVGTKLTEDQVKKWIRSPKDMNPKTLMMAYPASKISDGDLADLVAYMMTLKK